MSGEYSRTLLKREEKKRMTRNRRLNKKLLEGERRIAAREHNEDGYGDMLRDGKKKWWSRMMKNPLEVLFGKTKKKKTTTPKFGKAFGKNKKGRETGTLILVRHGESVWNANQTFTGWADPDMSERGYREIEHAARLLLEGGYEIDVVFTSRLKRAIRSVWVLLQELDEVYVPVFKSWRLNERMYGALTGLSKTETAEQLGPEIVQAWRGSLKSRPPPIRLSDRYWPGRQRKFADLPLSDIPRTESLLDCMERTVPVWEDKISYELRMGNTVMVVAHANTLRGLVKYIDEIGDDEIQEVAIPTGIPIIYKFDQNLHPIPLTTNSTPQQIHMKGYFLEKPGLLKEALHREEEWSSQVPGYDDTMGRNMRVMTQLERSLFKLKAERELGEWAGQFIDENATVVDDGNDGNMGKPIILVNEDDVWELGLGATTKHQQEEEEEEEELTQLQEQQEQEVITPTMINKPCITALPSTVSIPGMGHTPIRKDAVIVMIRHGKTEHNKLGLFTGWEDVPLAKDGIREAREAGKLLRLHGFEFDVVYTSWLSRAIETAWYVMDEMNCLWLPIIKSWRLNERMYGSLTGLSKRMVAQRHGEDQFKAWRRGFAVRPPKTSSFSLHYPGNDRRYRKYVNDVRVSVSESLIRSIESGKFVKARKLPKTESLKDCMDRTIPYFTDQIVPEAINNDKRVLISSSENAIRGLLMYLCDIPEDRITGLEIPNGLPLIFDVKSQCVKLLDDGTGRDPLSVYNFGTSGNYLFKPCLGEDGDPDAECDITYMSEAFKAEAEKALSESDKEVLKSLRRGSLLSEENKKVA